MKVEVKRTIHISNEDIRDALFGWVKDKIGYGGDDGIYKTHIDPMTCDIHFRDAMQGRLVEFQADLHVGVREICGDDPPEEKVPTKEVPS